jgi:hypothetical protein
MNLRTGEDGDEEEEEDDGSGDGCIGAKEFILLEF